MTQSPLEQLHVLLPWQARARSHAAVRSRSRVPGGSCCARGGLGRASSPGRPCDGPGFEPGVDPRREVLNCRPSTGGRFKIRGHHSTRLRQIRPAELAHQSTVRSRVPPALVFLRKPRARAIQRAARELYPTRACLEFHMLEVMLF